MYVLLSTLPWNFFNLLKIALIAKCILHHFLNPYECIVNFASHSGSIPSNTNFCLILSCSNIITDIFKCPGVNLLVRHLFTFFVRISPIFKFRIRPIFSIKVKYDFLPRKLIFFHMACKKIWYIEKYFDSRLLIIFVCKKTTIFLFFFWLNL